MLSLSNKRILLGITGGIAAYKCAELTRLFIKAGAEVRVVMTQSATEFITPLTLQALSGNRVHLDLLDPEAEAAMDAALQEFMARPIDADRMEALRTQIKAGQIYGKDDVEGLANQYGALLAQSLTVQDIQDWPEILASVTPEQIKEVAARVLNRDQSVTEWVVADREDAK